VDKHIRWVIENRRPEFGMMSDEEIEHVADCLESLELWYYHDQLPGDFLTAVVSNDLMEAFGCADDTNFKYLYLYATYLHNNMPADWREKGKQLRG